MNYYILIALQCGALVGIPTLTFLLGKRLLFHYEPNKKWITHLLFGLLIAVIGFEISFMGLLFDPDMTDINLQDKLISSVEIGLLAPVVIIVIYYLNKPICKFRDKIFKQWPFVFRYDGKYGKKDF